jgi:hypothetical protein
MDSLMTTIRRYGKAIQESCDPGKSLAVRYASAGLARQLEELIEARVKVLEQRQP